MLRFGPDADADGGPVVVVALPLFEEANRVRAFAVTLLRKLAARGIGGALPDLPGTGESAVPTVDATLADWRGAFAAAAMALARPAYAVTFRAGALIDADAVVAGRWRLSPCDGAALNHELRHAQLMAEAARGYRVTLAPLDRAAPPLVITGNRVSQALLVDLEAATVAPGRTVRLASDREKADRHVPGTPLWRRAEPGNDPALAAVLADDIADWIARCEG